MGGGSERGVTYTTATLHIFFPCLEETEEMIARLLNWEERDEREARKVKETRSRIFSTEQIPVPIDVVAARISGLEKVVP